MPNLEQISAWAQSPFAATLMVAVVVMLTNWLCLRAYFGKSIDPEPEVTFSVDVLREYYAELLPMLETITETKKMLECLRDLSEAEALESNTLGTHPLIYRIGQEPILSASHRDLLQRKIPDTELAIEKLLAELWKKREVKR